MKPDHRTLPLTGRKFDMWFAEETSIGGMVSLDLPEGAISKVLQEAETPAVDLIEPDWRVFQKAIDYSDVALAFDDVSCSRHPVQEAPEPAPSIQPAPMPCAGPLLKCAFFRTRRNQYGRFSYRRRITGDELDLWVGRSLDRHYLLRDRPIGIGVSDTSNARHSDRDADGQRCVCSTRRSQRANRIHTRLLQPPDEKAVSSCG